MTTPQSRSARTASPMLVTTNTGRILRIDPEEDAAKAAARAAAQNPGTNTGSRPVIIDPARRTDVLFRVRRDEGHELSPWWMIGAFIVSSGLVIALLSWVPYSA